MRIETAAARGRPPSGRVERRARSASRGGGFAIDVLDFGTGNGARATGAATVMLLNGLAEAALRTRRSNSSCSLALANSALASLAAIEWPAPLPPSVRACSSRAPLARQSVEQVVPLWRLRASACGGSAVERLHARDQHA
jgi:hypothetical protein